MCALAIEIRSIWLNHFIFKITMISKNCEPTLFIWVMSSKIVAAKVFASLVSLHMCECAYLYRNIYTYTPLYQKSIQNHILYSIHIIFNTIMTSILNLLCTDQFWINLKLIYTVSILFNINLQRYKQCLRASMLYLHNYLN